jgi:hypothetical protein
MLFLLNPAIQSDPPLPGFQPMQIYLAGKRKERVSKGCGNELHYPRGDPGPRDTHLGGGWPEHPSSQPRPGSPLRRYGSGICPSAILPPAKQRYAERQCRKPSVVNGIKLFFIEL